MKQPWGLTGKINPIHRDGAVGVSKRESWIQNKLVDSRLHGQTRPPPLPACGHRTESWLTDPITWFFRPSFAFLILRTHTRLWFNGSNYPRQILVKPAIVKYFFDCNGTVENAFSEGKSAFLESSNRCKTLSKEGKFLPSYGKFSLLESD